MNELTRQNKQSRDFPPIAKQDISLQSITDHDRPLGIEFDPVMSKISV